MAYHGSNSTMYGMTREGDLVTVDINSGQTVFKTNVATGPNSQWWSDLAIDPAGQFAYTVNAFGTHDLVKINLANYSHTVIGPTQWSSGTFQGQFLGVEFHNGRLLGAIRNNMRIVEINPLTARFDYTWGNGTMTVTNIQQIAVNPANNTLWSLHDGTGTAGQIVESNVSNNYNAPLYGTLPFGFKGTNDYGWGGLEFVPVPEPGTMLALAAGVAALVARRRSKR